MNKVSFCQSYIFPRVSWNAILKNTGTLWVETFLRTCAVWSLVSQDHTLLVIKFVRRKKKRQWIEGERTCTKVHYSPRPNSIHIRIQLLTAFPRELLPDQKRTFPHCRPRAYTPTHFLAQSPTSSCSPCKLLNFPSNPSVCYSVDFSRLGVGPRRQAFWGRWRRREKFAPWPCLPRVNLQRSLRDCRGENVGHRRTKRLRDRRRSHSCASFGVDHCCCWNGSGRLDIISHNRTSS